MSTQIKIVHQTKNPKVKERLLSSLEKKKLINKYIREGKDLKELHAKGIEFKMPV